LATTIPLDSRASHKTHSRQVLRNCLQNDSHSERRLEKSLRLCLAEDSALRCDSRGFGVARIILAVRLCLDCLVTAGPRSSLRTPWCRINHMSRHCRWAIAPMAWLCPRRGTERRYTISKMLGRKSGSKITALVLGWVEDSFVRSDNRGYGVAGSFSRYGFASIAW